MPTTRTEKIPALDDDSFDAHVAIPDDAAENPRPGLVVIQEIFGVNAYIRDVCDRLARAGYVTIAPDVFWRLERNVVIDEGGQSALERGIGYASKVDPAQVIGDLGVTLAYLRAMPECDGAAGVIGFCFGGTFAFLSAANLNPDCAVSYYGSGVAGAIDQAAKITCPIQFHFGGADPFLSNEDVAKVKAATAAMLNVELHVQAGAGHAFDNSFNPMFSNPTAATTAWAETTRFLQANLG